MNDDSKILEFEDIMTEEVAPYFFSEGLIHPPFKLYRINTSGNGRFYFRFLNEETFSDPRFYMGTGLVMGQMPSPKGLQKYREGLGTKAANYELHMWSLYGSFSDTGICDFVRNGGADLDELPERLREYFNDQRFRVEDYEMNLMSRSIKKDFIGFEKFIYDRKVEFVFLQYPVVSEIDGIATPIDIGCFMDIEVDVDKFKKNGEISKQKDKEIKRIFSLINYKSGAVYRNYAIQCRAELNMFKENYPEFTDKEVHVMNLTISDWKNCNSWAQYRGASDYAKPYKLTDWTEEPNEDDYRDYLSLAQRRKEKALSRKISTIVGKMSIGDVPEQFVVTKSIREAVEDGSWQKFQKSSAGIPEDFLIQTTI